MKANAAALGADAPRPEFLLASIVASSDDAIYSKSTDAIITSWNAAAERLYGYPAEEAIGRPLAMLVPEDRKGEEREILKQILAGERIEHYDTERRRKDGSVIPVSITVSPIIDPSGRIVGASTIARDIARRKQVEEMKDRFIAHAAHELRTPLSTLAALASALATRSEKIPEEQRRDLLDAMVRQGDRAKLLIGNLLELSQLESGNMVLKTEPVDVGDVVRTAVDGAPPPDGKSLEVDAGTELVAHGDRVRLTQVVTNLLTNAYRYGGSSVRVGATRAGDVVIVRVADDGAGVPNQLIDEIFDPFTRGPESGAKQGSGLGLAISRGLVEACGGNISYKHNRPHGAVFEIRLRTS